ncbi:hypothetical protein [Arthrospiribacter ruber]|uniref:Uncharacterized protein n=1 Tax=Arthrospiribacter ruber TaxID=2487934 RepID=A0A951MIZ5_9BACT|nr:hypothetical protein [Arthrospiribacter ruber]MBW3470031.1 hypothetical protein [Arthrospiribacter ruber]
MRIIKIEDEWIIFAKELDPIKSLEIVFGYCDLAYNKNNVNLFLESSFLVFPHETFKKEPSYTLFLAKLIREVIVSLYVLEERKKEFKNSSYSLSEGFLQRVDSISKKNNEMLWLAYPSSLSAKEVENPFKLIKRIKQILTLDNWMEFIDLCTTNCLGFGFEPEWDGFQEQATCTYFLPKMIDIGLLIYATENEFRRKTHKQLT